MSLDGLLNGLTIGFIGGGAMAEALITGITGLNREAVKPLIFAKQISVSDPNPQRRSYLKEKFSVIVSEHNNIAACADIVIIAVKPMVVSSVLDEVGKDFNSQQTIISIVAGIPTSFIENYLTVSVPVVRAMPNTPALLGAGAAALCCGSWADQKNQELALTIFSSIGWAALVPEKLMNAVTGLSGSGPAYMYLIVEAMTDAGVRMGLPRDIALKLTAQTMLGSARMILETDSHPVLLKDMVTTPGGTTIEGLYALEASGIRTSMYQAVEKACLRSSSLSSAL